MRISIAIHFDVASHLENEESPIIIGAFLLFLLHKSQKSQSNRWSFKAKSYDSILMFVSM